MRRYRRCYEVIYMQFVNVFFGYDPAVLYIRARYGRLIMVVKRDLIFRLKICWPIQSNDDIMLLYKLRDINSIIGINFFYKYWHYVYPSNSIFVNKSVLIKRIISKSIATAYLEEKIKKYNLSIMDTNWCYQRTSIYSLRAICHRLRRHFHFITRK